MDRRIELKDEVEIIKQYYSDGDSPINQKYLYSREKYFLTGKVGIVKKIKKFNNISDNFNEYHVQIKRYGIFIFRRYELKIMEYETQNYEEWDE